jgi:hypothetical protein
MIKRMVLFFYKITRVGVLMVNERLEKAKERLSAYYEAELAVLAGQSYSIGSRSLTRANLAWIRTQIDNLENQVEELKAMAEGKGRRKAFRITPRDL